MLRYSYFAIQTRNLKDWLSQYSTVHGLDMNIFVVPLLVYAIYIYDFTCIRHFIRLELVSLMSTRLSLVQLVQKKAFIFGSRI